MIEIETLRDALSYNAETGELAWKKRTSNKTHIGQTAGHVRKDGYRTVTVLGSRLLAHRAAWAIHTGSWPVSNIDHVNGDPGDNRFCNLRDVTQAENIQNLYRAKAHNRVGLLGVSADKKNFCARIVVDGKKHHLGNFQTAEEAHQAYLDAKSRLHIKQAAIKAGQPVAGARIVRKDRLTIT